MYKDTLVIFGTSEYWIFVQFPEPQKHVFPYSNSKQQEIKYVSRCHVSQLDEILNKLILKISPRNTGM